MTQIPSTCSALSTRRVASTTSVLDELRDGRKRSHWIWFVFPQLQGLGRSPTAIRYGISSLGEARAYLTHDVLGPRLRECARLVARIEGSSADEIFGWPDNLKVCSSMTLFATGHRTDNADFRAVLDKFYGGGEDAAHGRAAGAMISQPCGSTSCRRDDRLRRGARPGDDLHPRRSRGRAATRASGASSMLSATSSASESVAGRIDVLAVAQLQRRRARGVQPRMAPAQADQILVQPEDVMAVLVDSH